jgi:DegV family protein with EDD domain
MEQAIRIVTDSSCDLWPEEVEAFEIEVAPLVVHFGTKTYRDGELTVEEFWDKAAGPHPPHTSQPPVGVFDEIFERLVSRGAQVLCLTITGKHSGTFNAARLAAQRFGERVHVFDSLSLSMGLGLQAQAAARAARAGNSIQEILDLLKGVRERMRLTILLDTLENLRRGGRADAFIALADRMTRALNIKVLVDLSEGQLQLLGAARSFKRGLRRMLEQAEKMGPLEQLAVLHTRSQEMAAEMADRLAERLGFSRERICVRETGAVLSAHAGKGVIAVLALPGA